MSVAWERRGSSGSLRSGHIYILGGQLTRTPQSVDVAVGEGEGMAWGGLGPQGETEGPLGERGALPAGVWKVWCPLSLSPKSPKPPSGGASWRCMQVPMGDREQRNAPPALSGLPAALAAWLQYTHAL